METRERNSINYFNPPQSNQDSSPNPNTRRNETQHHLHQGNNYHGFNLQREKLEPQRARRDPNPDLDRAIRVSQTASLAPTTVRPAVVVRYRECLKNHAANKGTHVLDGCGEFMPGGEPHTSKALKCAACDCHRSFHRREVDGESNVYHYTPQLAAPPRAATVYLTPAAPTIQPQRQRHHRPMPPIMMAFGGANRTAAESYSEDFNIFQTYAGVQLMQQTSKKRFRTKFTQEQKDKMFEFAERIGWKIQKQDDQDVLRFCNEVGLKKQVFKVWMHNNKQAAKKK